MVAASVREVRANRENAQKSTGPTSEAGKVRSSLNGISHGIFAKSLILPCESQAELDEFSAGMLRRLNPRDVLELELAEQIIAAHWRLKRVRTAEKDYLKFGINKFRPLTEKGDSFMEMFASSHESLARLDKYAQRLERLASTALRELRQLQKDDLDEPCDFTAELIRKSEPNPVEEDRKINTEKDLATDGAQMHTDQRERNVKLTCDTVVPTVPATGENEKSFAPSASKTD